MALIRTMALALLACVAPLHAHAQARPDVTVFAAASLREALDELAREYER
jgi:ABC-type molybdate transport system substrate-binding protein